MNRPWPLGWRTAKLWVMSLQQSELGDFLKMLRRRIPPDSSALGPWKRLPVRCGRPVTQEEAAEIVGVSRNWYCMLESGARVRASMKLLNRLANAFAFTPQERTRLFLLAIPEIGYVSGIQ
jgi:DNA-binding XRE family transcriptional regulator